MGAFGDLSPQGTVAIGIIVGLISTSVQSLGLTIQRKSHLLEDEKDLEDRIPAWKRPRWQIGMLMFVASNLIGSTIQITTLPLPVLSTLQASGLVFNTAFATILLKEPFTRYSAAGTILTCAGAGLIATFGAIGEPAHNLQQLVALLKRKAFIVWMVCTLLVALATVLFAHVLKVYSSHKHISKHWNRLSEQTRLGSTSGIEYQHPRRSFTAQLPRQMQLRVSRLRLIRGLSYALISGILSAHSLLMAKSAVELIVRTIVDHRNEFKQFQSWLILLALVFFALSQLYYLHLGLRLCSTSVLYPFVFCIYNIIAILDGLIYFRQASALSILDAWLIALGTIVLLAGVLALSWRLDDSTPQDSMPQVLQPNTPLAPGMGLVRASEELERSPLLSPSPKRRSLPGTSHSPLLGSHRGQGYDSFADESASVQVGRKRARTLATITRMSVADADHREIWAEIEDEDDNSDVLASLPRSTSLFLTHKKRERRGSGSSQALSTSSTNDDRIDEDTVDDTITPIQRSLFYQNQNASGSGQLSPKSANTSKPSSAPRRSQTLQSGFLGPGSHRRFSAPGGQPQAASSSPLVSKPTTSITALQDGSAIRNNRSEEVLPQRSSDVDEETQPQPKRARSRGATVHFADQDRESRSHGTATASRWDASAYKKPRQQKQTSAERDVEGEVESEPEAGATASHSRNKSLEESEAKSKQERENDSGNGGGKEKEPEGKGDEKDPKSKEAG